MNKIPSHKPKKRTEKQREASRRNGAKSQGPVTPEGKAVSARNHTTHGLCAYQSLLLNNENGQNLELLHQTYLQRFQPADPVEHDLVEQIVAAQWRLRRYTAVETALIDGAMRRHLNELPPPSCEGDRCGRAFGDLADNANSLALAGRYQARNSREYYRAMKTLVELRREIPVPPGSSPLPPAGPPPRPGVHFPDRPQRDPEPAESVAAAQPDAPSEPPKVIWTLSHAALFTLLLLALVLPAFAALLASPRPAEGSRTELPFEPEHSLSRTLSVFCPKPATNPDRDSLPCPRHFIASTNSGGSHSTFNPPPPGDPLRLPPSAFRLPSSVFRLPSSVFPLPPSVFRLPPSPFGLPPSVFPLPPSVFRLPPSPFRLPTSVF